MLQLKRGSLATVISLDANILLRFFLNDVPEQSDKAQAAIAGSAIYVTDVVLTEVVFVLERVIEMDRADIVRLVQSFLSLPNVVYNDYFLDQTIDLYGAKKTLSFVDCYAATEARMYKNSLITFDKQLLRHGGNHVMEP
jgi:predicted nucleic-acid-binding protein